jgi:hypothetical protein
MIDVPSRLQQIARADRCDNSTRDQSFSQRRSRFVSGPKAPLSLVALAFGAVAYCVGVAHSTSEK